MLTSLASDLQPPTPMPYTGFYINLDRSADRRRAIEQKLAQAGLTYNRFAASDGNSLNFPSPKLKAGEIGCFTSHYLVLKENQHSVQPLHIIEDDIILSPQLPQVLGWAIDSGQLAKYDIVFTDVAVPLLNDACHAYKAFYDATVKRDASGKISNAVFAVIDMRELIFASASSLLVNPQSIGKLATLYGQELAAGAALPVDLHIRKLCQDGALRVGCIFPFVTSIEIDTRLTTISEKRFDDLPAMAANMLRHSFYIDCDWNACLDAAQGMFPQPDSGDTHRQLMLRLLGYSLGADYKKC